VASYTLCPTCGEQVSPDEPGVVEAVEMVDVGGYGSTSDEAEGQKALFHGGCFPKGSPKWRRL